MKKLLLLAMLGGLLGWLPSRTRAQDRTTYWGGTITLNGDVRSSRAVFSSSASNKSRHSIAPELQWGRFINTTTMIGLGSRYSFTWNKGESGSPSTPSQNRNSGISQSIALLPFIRKYKPLGERWAVFLHAELGPTYNWRNSKSMFPGWGSSPDKGHNWQYELSVKPGVVYFLPKNNLAIEGYANILSLGATYTDLENDNGRQFIFSTGLSTSFPSYFTIRIAKYIPRKTN